MSGNKRVRILYVEDDQVDQIAFKRMFGKELPQGDLTIADSVEKAGDELETNEFDIIVTDFKLNDGTALDVLELIGNVPVIITTGAGDQETAVEAMKKGAADYIVKDIDRQYLEKIPQIIENVLDKARLIRFKEEAEIELNEQKEFLEHIIEALQHPFYVIDAKNHKILLANESALKGRPLENQTCYHLTHGNDKPCSSDEHSCPLEIVVRTGEPVTMEHKHLDKNNEPKIFEVHGYPLKDEQGNVIQIIESSIDITARKLAEESLRRSEEKYRLLTESTNDIIYSTDIEGDIKFISPQIEKYGIRRDEIVDKKLVKYIHPDDKARVEQDFFRAMTKGEEFPTLFRIIDAGGNDHWLEDQGRMMRNDEGEIIGITGVLRDITERKRNEEEIKKKNKELERFSKLAVGRELRMKELKYRIKELELTLSEAGE